VIDFSPATAALLFVTYVVVDVLYALYIVCVEERQAAKAAAISSLLYSLLAFGVVTYSKNPVYLVPIAAGAFVGTYLTVKFKQ
jgi:tryptophan-rich sensory protein